MVFKGKKLHFRNQTFTKMHPFLQILESLRERPPSYHDFSIIGEQKHVLDLGLKLILTHSNPPRSYAAVTSIQQIADAMHAVRTIVCAYAFVMYPERTHEGPINETLALHTAMAARGLIKALWEMDSAESNYMQALGMLDDPTPVADDALVQCRERFALCFNLFRNAFVVWRRADLPHMICRLEDEGATVTHYMKWLYDGLGEHAAAEVLREARFIRRTVQVNKHRMAVERFAQAK